MKALRRRRLPGLALVCLAGAGVASLVVWAMSGFALSGPVNIRFLGAAVSAGVLLPIGLSLFNVFWKETLYQNLPMLGALLFSLCFDLVFVLVLAVATLWTGGIINDPIEILAWLTELPVLCGLICLILLWFIHHFIRMVQLILGKGQLGRFLFGRRKYPMLLERFVLAIELVDPPAQTLETGAPRYLSFLNDFYQELELVASALGGEIVGFSSRGARIVWKEVKGGANNQALFCIFDLRQRLKQHQTWFEVVYHCAPRFRTALHFGQVISAEMGWKSKTIVTQGEAVEITDRLVQSCGKLREDFLVSEAAMDRLVLPAASRIHRSVNAQMAGKNESMRVYALEQIIR